MEEIWKVYLHKKWNSPVYGLKTIERESILEVSNLGRVKRNGKIVTKFHEEKYYRFAGFRIHRAVAELFVSNPNNYNEVDHIDNNTHNNRADNLKWCTHKQNMNNPVTKKTMSNSIKKWYNNKK